MNTVCQMDFSNDIVISQLNETEYQLEMEEMKRKRCGISIWNHK